MTKEEAREILKQVILHVDLMNLGRTISALGEHELTWKTFDNSKWRPNKELALKESKWLAENAGDVYQALNYFKEIRNEA